MTLAGIIHRFGDDFAAGHHPNAFTLHVLRRLCLCKTAAMGGHAYRCDSCGHEVVCYNSCKNRHCPACQGTDQALWAERQVAHAYPGRHYHLVFTVPHELNVICLTDSRGTIVTCFPVCGIPCARSATATMVWRRGPSGCCIPGDRT